ncbi:hypothetical protein CDV36_005842 [Fusarium kuroshium]|uniref:Uncharacterized protein n=1 Tax=Fusarium kuroshium TaxID=2010991 RepID=A0A3M2SA92_9HYPO|nr:hypothetical protein CDV36_005842 [Fusarium kuroshium]
MAPSYSGTQKTYLPDLTQPSSQGSFPLPGTTSTSTSASHPHTPTLTPPVAPPPAAPPRCLLVFNKAVLPSSFPDPLFDSFLVNFINHHHRLSKPTTRSLSSLLTSPNSLRKSSSTPVTRFFLLVLWVLNDPFFFFSTNDTFSPISRGIQSLPAVDR